QNPAAVFAPPVEEDLAAGASRELALPVAGRSRLSATARWIGTTLPLTVTLALDGTTLATGMPYTFAGSRGGALVSAQPAAGGRATVTVTNTTDTTVHLKIVLEAIPF